MSPTSKELISNKALQGTELAKIILSDAATLLAENGLLCGQMAFARVSYELHLTLHLDLPSLPVSIDTVRSRPRSDNAIKLDPALVAIESVPPLASPSPQAILTSDELHRDIQSPNVARLEHGLPVDVGVKDQDGHVTEHQVQYPADYPGMEPAPPTTRDVTAATRAELGLPPDSSDEIIAAIAEEARNAV